LLVQLGYAGLSIERVAAEARVAKTTIYRRWPTKLDLCLALLPRVLQALPIVEHGDARGDLRDFFLTVFAVATTEPGRIIPPLIAEAVHNAELRESFQQGYLRPRRERAILMAEHMIERGEIAAETDPSLFYDMLGGYIWFRRLVIGVPITAAEADAAVSALLDGTRKRRGPSENGPGET
jgi:AcrR family transcriptional regulator